MNNGLFQPMLDPNGMTNGIPNAAINAARQRANEQYPQGMPSQGQMSPEELRAQMGRLQSFGRSPSDMPQKSSDMSTMYPGGMPQFQDNQMPRGSMPRGAPSDMSVMSGTSQEEAGMPTLNGPPPGADGTPIPSYVGNPVLDKYIHQFIGAA